MNKHIITILIATFTTSVFAADHMLINGKKVSMNDTRSTLIQKLDYRQLEYLRQLQSQGLNAVQRQSAQSCAK